MQHAKCKIKYGVLNTGTGPLSIVPSSAVLVRSMWYMVHGTGITWYWYATFRISPFAFRRYFSHLRSPVSGRGRGSRLAGFGEVGSVSYVSLGAACRIFSLFPLLSSLSTP